MSMNDAAVAASGERRANRAPRRMDAAEIERVVGLPVENAERIDAVEALTTLEVVDDRCLLFRDRFAEDDIAAINAFAGRSALFALPAEYRGRVEVAAIFLDQPREAFIAIAAALFDYYGTYWQGFEDAGAAQQRNPGAILMPGCFVHPTARIGEGSMIFPGVVVGPRSRIGRNSMIKSNSVIGLTGFGIHRAADKTNLHLPHVGGVVMGDDVELGALCTVCAGTVHPTTVADNVKTDDHVHIAHNCAIGRGAQLTAHAELSGSVTVGAHAFLGPNCSIGNGTTIGEGAIVGIASAVLKDVQPHKLVVGNPARVLRDLP
ncbi:MAG: hypothetical protein ACEQR8_03770 [Cypionkella sp.]